MLDDLNDMGDTPQILRDMGFQSIRDLSLRMDLSEKATRKMVNTLGITRTVVGRRIFIDIKALEKALREGGLPHKRKGRPPGKRAKK